MITLAAIQVATAQPVSTAEDARVAVRRGVAFLLEDQNPDGSWGGAREAIWTFTGDVWSNPETHRAWRVATTGLCVMALLETAHAEARPACDKALDYVLANTDVKQPNEWDTMNSWTYIYGLHCIAVAYNHAWYRDDASRRARMLSGAAAFCAGLARVQSTGGGWGYLELDPPRTARPQWATSFTTGAGVVALADAKEAGLPIDADLLARAARTVKRCALPSGAYTYSLEAIADPRSSEWIDQIKGSLGRIQVCNVALKLVGEPMPAEKISAGLANFFRHHRFLDIARNRPIPHETYYFNSGYFYLFGHYYAARAVRALPRDEQARWWPRLRQELIKIQQADGSMYDYDMHAYHKPYGTAFGLLALAASTE